MDTRSDIGVLSDRCLKLNVLADFQYSQSFYLFSLLYRELSKAVGHTDAE
jgi:hypothetical protein